MRDIDALLEQYPALMTPAEVAEVFRCTGAQVRRLTGAGILPSVRIGVEVGGTRRTGTIRISKAVVREFLGQGGGLDAGVGSEPGHR